ncbi:MAG: sugar kinase, partial [Candidatus Aenigmatarchaeota archaeon]
KIGLKTKFIGRLGYDFISNFLIKEIRSIGVESRIRRVEGERAGITISLNFEDTKRAMISFVGSNANLCREDFELDEIEGEVLHIGGFNLLDNLRKDVFEIFKYARKKGMKTSLDPNWDPKGWSKERVKDLEKVLRLTNFFFPDYEEGKAMSKVEDPERIVKKLLEKGPEVVALKCGKKGCFVGRYKEILHEKAFKVKALQTTGAGDCFNAGFLRAYLSGFTLEECARFANACGALYTTNFGRERFVSENVVKGFLKSF